MLERFTYFSSTLSKSIVMDDEVNTRLAKASAVFSQLKRNVLNLRGISEATKIKVYQADVLTTLLYGCETWTIYQRHIKKRSHLHTTSLRMIVGITWPKHILNTEDLTQASLPNTYTISMQSQLRWTAVSAWKITASRRKCSPANCLSASTL